MFGEGDPPGADPAYYCQRWKGLGLGLFLWLVMQVAVLPLLGWGLFGTAITPAIAVATLVLHLIYGGVLGWGLSR